jgi:hypothetical protein
MKNSILTEIINYLKDRDANVSLKRQTGLSGIRLLLTDLKLMCLGKILILCGNMYI